MPENPHRKQGTTHRRKNEINAIMGIRSLKLRLWVGVLVITRLLFTATAFG